MSARGRLALLRGLAEKRLTPTKTLSDRIFSCLLCEACKGICPLGLDIPEIIYGGRRGLRNSSLKGRLLGGATSFFINRMDIAFLLLSLLRRVFSTRFSYLPPITTTPLKRIQGVYRNRKAVGRVAVFLGCSVNYIYPSHGEALINILRRHNYEVVILSGEVCCGAPLRSMGLEDEMIPLAKRNIEIFKNIKAMAVVSLCPTCTMVIKRQYPLLTGDMIPNIMDVNEFLVRHGILKGLMMGGMTVTYHDPCHLSYGLGITEEPRRLLQGIEGIRFVEMRHPRDCCGFGGPFSMLFKDLSMDIGRRKIEDIKYTDAKTVVTSCPGCIMQLGNLKRQTGTDIQIMHIVELIDRAMSI